MKPKKERNLFVAAISITLVFVLAYVFMQMRSFNELQKLHEKDVFLAENIGKMLRLDEMLTMMAKMSAMGGDVSRGKYYKYKADLNKIIRQILAFPYRKNMLDQVRNIAESRQQLINMDVKAMALAGQAKNSEALAVLKSEEYIKNKENYAKGTNILFNFLFAENAKYDKAIRFHQFVAYAVGAVGLCFVLFCYFLFMSNIFLRRKSELRLRRLNRSHVMISQCNQIMVRTQSEEQLLNGICHNVIDFGGYLMSWVGFVEHDEAKSVRPISHAGHEEGYLSTIKISWGDNAYALGPTGTAIRTGRLSINRDITTDSKYSPWRQEAVKRGYVASIALPLIVENKSIGALNIYSGDKNVFDHEEVKLLEQLAGDLSFGISAMRARKERNKLEERLRQTYDNLEIRVQKRTMELAKTNVALQEEMVYRQKIESEISVSNRQMEFILEATKSNLDIVDAEYNMVYVDPILVKTYGDYKARKCYEYFLGHSAPCAKCGVAKALAGKKPVVTQETLKKEGNRRIEVTTVPFQDKDGKWLAAEVSVDIAHRQ
ncbi:MAG: GAF domain-containing protein [Candidatus Omnitrophota bacterium]